jgi:hypothetical protein
MARLTRWLPAQPSRPALHLESLEDRTTPTSLLNLSFEDTPDLTGWTVTNGPGAGSATVVRGNGQATDGTAYARLVLAYQNGSFGRTEFGPSLQSGNITLTAGDTLGLDFRPVETDDDTFVRIRLFTDTGVEVGTLFDGTFNGQPGWQSVSATAPANGDYYLVAQVGSFDETFGGVLGAELHLDNIRTAVTAPLVADIPPQANNSNPSTITVSFNQAIDPATFTTADLYLSRGSSSTNLINGSVTITQLSATTYEVGGLGSLTSADGVYRFRVNATTVTTAGGTAGLGNAFESWTTDTVAPTVTGVTRTGPQVTSAASVTFTVSFSEFVQGVDVNDFTLTTTGTLSGATVTGVSGSGTSRTVTVSTGSGDGTLRLDVLAGGITDAVGNALTPAYTSGQEYTLDRTPPAAPTVTSPASAVTVNAATFAVTGTAEANALVRVYRDLNNNGVIDGSDAVVGSQQLSGGATGYSITVPLTQDAANNFLVRAFDAAGNLSPLADVPTITEDSTAATVTAVTPPASGVYKAGRHLDFVLTFGEPVTVTGTPRVQLTVGGSAVWATYLTGTGTNALTFRYTVQPGDTDADGVSLGTSISLNGGTLVDAGGNNASVAVPVVNTAGVRVDTTAPTTAMTSPTPTATNAGSIPVTVTFSEAVSGFDAADVLAMNATVGNFVMVNATTYTFTLTPTADGAVSVQLTGFAGVTDAAGNPAVPPSALNWVSDRTSPTATVALADGQTGVSGQDTVRFVVTFSEAVSGFDAADVILGGTAEGGRVSVTGSGNSYVVTVTGLTRGGTVNIRLADGAGIDALGNPSAGSGVSPEVRYSPVPTGLTTSPTGDGASGTEIQIRNPGTTEVVNIVDPFPGFRGVVDTAVADLTGDGVWDVAAGAGAGGGPHVKVIDGATGEVLHSFYAFHEGFTGGVDLATGDVNGDGIADLIVAAGAGGGPHVKVFDGRTLALLSEFYAYDPSFGGGVSVAVGDLDGDGRAEILTGAGAGGGPHVKAFNALTLEEVLSFYAYDPSFGGGVNVAVGDLNGDGRAEILTGAGPGGGPHVKAFNGQTLDVVHSFYAYHEGFTGGVDVAARDVNADGYADIVTGAGAGGGPHVKAFDGRTLALLNEFFAAEEFFNGGVYVG